MTLDATIGTFLGSSLSLPLVYIYIQNSQGVFLENMNSIDKVEMEGKRKSQEMSTGHGAGEQIRNWVRGKFEEWTGNNFDADLEKVALDMKPVIPTDHLVRAVGHSEVMGFSGYLKECLYREYNKSDGSYVSAVLDFIEKLGGRKIAAGFIVSDGIPGLVQVTNGNCVIPSMISQPPRHPESVVVGEGVKCIACIRAEDLLGEHLKNMKNKFGKLDFPSFPQGWKVCDGNNVPPYLNYLHEELGGSVTATTTLISKDMVALSRAYVYAAIDEMHKMKLEDITNEDVMRKWGCVMRDAKKMGLDVEFAEEHLKKIAHAYFLSMGPAAERNKEEHVICSMPERESFDDGALLTKGLLLFAPSEQSA